jgi:hypothetical protein
VFATPCALNVPASVALWPSLRLLMGTEIVRKKSISKSFPIYGREYRIVPYSNQLYEPVSNLFYSGIHAVTARDVFSQLFGGKSTLTAVQRFTEIFKYTVFEFLYLKISVEPFSTDRRLVAISRI